MTLDLGELLLLLLLRGVTVCGCVGVWVCVRIEVGAFHFRSLVIIWAGPSQTCTPQYYCTLSARTHLELGQLLEGQGVKVQSVRHLLI